MRTPTDRGAAWQRWRDWLAGGPPPNIARDAPCCGLYKATIGRRHVPMMIDLEPGETDENGDLCTDENFICEIDGESRDVDSVWGFLRFIPVTEDQFEALKQTREATRGVTDLSKDIII